MFTGTNNQGVGDQTSLYLGAARPRICDELVGPVGEAGVCIYCSFLDSGDSAGGAAGDDCDCAASSCSAILTASMGSSSAAGWR